jgi:hypothetical protein
LVEAFTADLAMRQGTVKSMLPRRFAGGATRSPRLAGIDVAIHDPRPKPGLAQVQALTGIPAIGTKTVVTAGCKR